MYEELKGKTVLVTGGAGFIGSHLCERLLELGARVVCVDNLSTGKKENLDGIKVLSHGTDVNKDTVDLEEIFKKYKPDYVFHYAAMVGVKNVIERPLEVFNDIQGIKNILELSKEFGVKKIIFSSSSEAYGEPIETPEKEQGPINVKPHDPYALTKLVGECMMYHYYNQYKLPTCSLRFFNVYGPRQESSAYGFVTGVFIRQVLGNKPPTIFGDGSQTRDFVYVKDNIEASIQALLSKETDGETINIGRGQATTILDLAERIIKLSGKDLKPVFLPEREVEIKYRNPDVSKMKKLIGYEPKVSLDEGLKLTFDWYKENVGK